MKRYKEKYPLEETQIHPFIDFRNLKKNVILSFDSNSKEYEILQNMSPRDFDKYLKELVKFNVDVEFNNIKDVYIIRRFK